MAGTSGTPSVTAAKALTEQYGGAAFSVTGPIKVLWLSAVRTANNGTDSEWTTGGSYVAGTGFSGLTMGTPTQNATGAIIANTNAPTITNCPAQSWAGNKIVDSSATPQELAYAPRTGGTATVNAGDTVIIPVGSLTHQRG